MRLFGLIGYPLAQSFSKKYFTEKFVAENITDAAYELFELNNIEAFPSLLNSHQHLCGINVTIPYKQAVLPYLHHIQAEALAMGAVNCIKVCKGVLTGFNTDAPAFEKSLKPLLQPYHTKALVLGTGGAAKAVVYVLQKLGIEFKYVSRTRNDMNFIYEDLTPGVMEAYLLIVNCTPLGSFPKVDTAPPIPYDSITNAHYLYDLVYNPPITKFLAQGQMKGATIKNGYDMLTGQAELGWQIWNS